MPLQLSPKGYNQNFYHGVVIRYNLPPLLVAKRMQLQLYASHRLVDEYDN